MLELLITNALKSLFFPPGGILLLLLLGLLLLKSRPVAARRVLWGAFGIGYLLSTPLISTLLLQSLQSYPALDAAMIRQAPAQAIVVLSAGRYKAAAEYGADTADHNTLARLRYGAHLQRLTGLPVLVSGGHVLDAEGDSLAQVMARSLRDDFGIAEVWLEDRSRTTAENARLSQALLAEKNIDSVFLVSQAFHMPRAVRIFEQAGLKVVPAPTQFAVLDERWFLLLLPSARAMADSYLALHELGGGLWYAVRH